MTNKREIKAIQLLAKGNNIKPLSRSKFLVRSVSNPLRWHEVAWKNGQWCCECEDYAKRKIRCKHIYVVSYFLALREIAVGVKDPEHGSVCKKCHSAKYLVKYGVRPNQSGPAQKLYCKRCKTWSTDRGGFERMKNQTIVIVSALDLYFRNVSLRQISQHLHSTFGIYVSYGAIYNWIRKYVELVSRYTGSLKMITSERWHADETLIKVRSRLMVLWSLLDSETRQQIAYHISQSRSKEEAVVLLRKGKKASKNVPAEVVTDGLLSYNEAIETEFANKNDNGSNHGTLHIVGPLVGKINNNKIERFNESIKGRIKVMGKLSSREGAETFAKGYQIHYNWIRGHKALNGRTPTQASNKSTEKMNWKKLIEKASEC